MNQLISLDKKLLLNNKKIITTEKPSGPVLPNKGDIISFDITGTIEQYKVLKLQGGNLAKVLCCKDVGETEYYNNNNNLPYSQTNVKQYVDQWAATNLISSSVISRDELFQFFEQNGNTFNPKQENSEYIEVMAYPLSLGDIIDYFGSNDISYWNLDSLLNLTMVPSGSYILTANCDFLMVGRAYYIDVDYGSIIELKDYNTGFVYPVLTVDLTNLPYNIVN